MPRRSSNKSSSPTQRRQSARLAAASANKSPTPSPSPKKPRRSSKRDTASKTDTTVENVEHNGNESNFKGSPDVEEPVEKKARIEEAGDVTEKLPQIQVDSSTKDLDVAKEAGFEVIEKSSAPAADSEEVKKAIEAQGEDGQLLVNYVQVIKDEIPAVPESSASASDEKQHQSSNGTEEKDDASAEATAEGHTTEQPSEEPPAAEDASH